ncbi:PCYCGC motif-containing (lipo)protein [Candidatus Amarolinea aalborgensis]|uniref:PCYCGC motif-containing (lipo)protein n=1 Tax=Candidatus Amarolinea aalborgensis TaxID=2249329 RepID=UPI003BF99F10
MSKRRFFLLPALIIGSFLLAACTAGGQQTSKVTLAPVSALPQPMQDAPAAVRTAYQFAVMHPDALKNVPCYCGCGAIGHKSNLACYIKEFGADGKPVFDDHAMGCSLCVDIATDVMKMTGEGKSPAAIRQQIVDTYSKFGPANQ